MKTLLGILALAFSLSTLADSKVLCTYSDPNIHAALSLKLSSQNELLQIIRKKGTNIPFETDEDYTVTELSLIVENGPVRVYDVVGEEGDQSYYDARLIVPRAGKVTWVKWEYSQSGDDHVLPPTKLTLRCK